MSDTDQMEYTDIMPRVGELAGQLLEHPDRKVREAVEELLDWIDAFHRDGLGRLVEAIRGWRGEAFLMSCGEDEILGPFLDAYDLGEGDDRDTAAEDAIMAALEELRPFVESHGGTIAFDSVADGVVKVQMLGSCDGCPSSSATLTGGVEEALRRHWPNFRRLEVIDPNEGAAPADDGHGHGHDHAAPSAAGVDPQPVLLQIGKKPGG